MKNYLTEGDPINPQPYDLIVQTETLPIGEAPAGDFWYILTGNARSNMWARVAMRYVVEAKGRKNDPLHA